MLARLAARRAPARLLTGAAAASDAVRAAALERVLGARDHFSRLGVCGGAARARRGAARRARSPAPLSPRARPPRSPASFDVDAAALEAALKSLQRAVHPDFFAGAPAAERARAARASAALNAAYRTLRAPLARAEYLLALAEGGGGGEAAEGDGGDGGAGAGAGAARAAAPAAPASPALLAQVMAARELIDDAATPRAALAALAARSRAAVAACEADLGAAFRARDAARARAVAGALSFYAKIVEEADAAAEARGGAA